MSPVLARFARPPFTRRTAGALLAFGLMALGSVVVAAPSVIDLIDRAATAGQVADRIEQPVGDVVVVFDIGEVDLDLAVTTGAAARDAGGVAMGSRGAAIGMIRVHRGGATVQQAPAGMRYPMTVTAMTPAAIAGTIGPTFAAQLDANSVVMSARTAGLRGAQAGDMVDLVAANGSLRTMRVAAIAPDDVIGGTELLMTDMGGGSVGVTADTRVVIWGFSSRAAIDQALAARGVTSRRETRIVRSWDPMSPDSTLSTAETKQLLGEFAFALTPTGGVIQESAWQAANLPAGRVLLSSFIPIRARCHNRILADLTAALDEVAAAGLASAIDVTNANTYGGCHNARFNRISGELGFLSRHAWAQALDTNTVSNCQGCVPRMNCGVVRIFRKHNFAWGGNFLRPDGMHFEWVGERRDLVVGPAQYCPNIVSFGASTEVPPDAQPSRELLFGVDNLDVSHDC